MSSQSSVLRYVDVGRGKIVDALVIAPVVVVRDERIDLGFEVTGQIIVLEQVRFDVVRWCSPADTTAQVGAT